MTAQLENINEDNNRIFYSLLEKFQENLTILPDKPEEKKGTGEIYFLKIEG